MEWRAQGAAAIFRGMARTVLLRLPDGTYAIRPRRRYGWVWLAIAAACVLLPLLLSLVISLPAVVFLLPLWTLGVGLWVLLRTLDSPTDRYDEPPDDRGGARPPAPRPHSGAPRRKAPGLHPERA